MAEFHEDDWGFTPEEEHARIMSRHTSGDVTGNKTKLADLFSAVGKYRGEDIGYRRRRRKGPISSNPSDGMKHKPQPQDGRSSCSLPPRVAQRHHPFQRFPQNGPLQSTAGGIEDSFADLDLNATTYVPRPENRNTGPVSQWSLAQDYSYPHGGSRNRSKSGGPHFHHQRQMGYQTFGQQDYSNCSIYGPPQSHKRQAIPAESSMTYNPLPSPTREFYEDSAGGQYNGGIGNPTSRSRPEHSHSRRSTSTTQQGHSALSRYDSGNCNEGPSRPGYARETLGYGSSNTQFPTSHLQAQVAFTTPQIDVSSTRFPVSSFEYTLCANSLSRKQQLDLALQNGNPGILLKDYTYPTAGFGQSVGISHAATLNGQSSHFLPERHWSVEPYGWLNSMVKNGGDLEEVLGSINRFDTRLKNLYTHPDQIEADRQVLYATLCTLANFDWQKIGEVENQDPNLRATLTILTVHAFWDRYIAMQSVYPGLETSRGWARLQAEAFQTSLLPDFEKTLATGCYQHLHKKR